MTLACQFSPLKNHLWRPKTLNPLLFSRGALHFQWSIQRPSLKWQNVKFSWIKFSFRNGLTGIGSGNNLVKSGHTQDATFN